ncbi:MAG: lipoprotein [Phycisphaerales bacterium]|nr:lipoprotein [Phycisphaerales bacterium]
MKSHLHRLAACPKGRVRFAALILVLPLASGCATVKPWQRETLADPIMQPGRNPLAAAQLDHVYFSREAASGGTTVGGGGCGCN